MAHGTLVSLFREPKSRLTDRAAFVQAVSRLSSSSRSSKGEDIPKPRKGDQKAGKLRRNGIFI